MDELKQLQPELTIINDRIIGCFYLSASIKKQSKRKTKIIYYAWNNGINKNYYLHNYFYIDITLDKDLYISKAFETSGKLLSWQDKISPEYWHVNNDNSLCLGIKKDILEKQKECSFAQFINRLFMDYFYYMHYTKKHNFEPWEAYRHGLFQTLELACDNDVDIYSINKILQHEEFYKLLKKTRAQKIEKKDNCPFCHFEMLTKNCDRHKKQIKGYNKIICYLIFSGFL